MKIEVDLSIAGEFDLDGLGELMLVLHHHLHPQLLGLFQCLHHFRLLLDLDDEAVLVAIDDLTSVADRRVNDVGGGVDVHHLQDRSIRALVHLLKYNRRSDHIEIKVGIREWLADQGVVPPLLFIRPKAVLLHHCPKKVSFFRLFRWDQCCAGMGTLSKEIKVAAHEDCTIISIGDHCSISERVGEELDFVNGLAQSNNGQIYSASSGMAGFGSYIAVRNDPGLIEIGVELCLSLVVLWLFAPAHEVIDCFLRTIRIIDHQRVPKFFEIGLHISQRVTSALGDDDCLAQVPIYHLTHKVLGDGIAWLENDGGVYIGQVVEGSRHLAFVHAEEQQHQQYDSYISHPLNNLWMQPGVQIFHQAQYRSILCIRCSFQKNSKTIIQQFPSNWLTPFPKRVKRAVRVIVGILMMIVDKSDLLLFEGDDGGGLKEEGSGLANDGLEVLGLLVGFNIGLSLVLLEEDIDSLSLLDSVDVVSDDTSLSSGLGGELLDQGLSILDVLGLNLDKGNDVDVFSHKICVFIINLPPFVENQCRDMLKNKSGSLSIQTLLKINNFFWRRELAVENHSKGSHHHFLCYFIVILIQIAVNLSYWFLLKRNHDWLFDEKWLTGSHCLDKMLGASMVLPRLLIRILLQEQIYALHLFDAVHFIPQHSLFQS